jgi:hypothetical protein
MRLLQYWNSWLLVVNRDVPEDTIRNVMWIFLFGGRGLSCVFCEMHNWRRRRRTRNPSISGRDCSDTTVQTAVVAQYSDGILMYLWSAEQMRIRLYRIRRRLSRLMEKQHIPSFEIQFHPICNTLQTSLLCPVSTSVGGVTNVLYS